MALDPKAAADAAEAKILADAADAKAIVAKAAADAADLVANAANNKATAGISRTDMLQSNLPSQPRLRVEKNTNINLTTSWQRIDFSDSNPLNINTFPMMADNTTPYVRWDGTNKLFKFGANEDRNYTLDVDLVINNSALLTTLLGLNMVKVCWRLVVPNGRGAGLTYSYPFPGTDGSDGYGEIGLTTSLLSNQRLSLSRNIYASASTRTNGLGFELKISTNGIGTIACGSATALIYGR